MRTAEIVLGLLVLASAVAVFADRVRLPAPSLLVLAGLGVALIPGVPAVHVTPQLVSLVVLPPLLFASAVDVVSSDLRAVLRPVAVLAIGLVVASAVVVAFVVHATAPQVSVSVALVLGAVLASTDPVAVSALARRLRLPPRLLALVQGESLLNDATSLLLFRVVVGGVVAGHLPGPLSFTGRFFGLGAGGAAIGLACAVVVRQLHQRTDDAVIDAVIAVIAPYAMFVAAEVAHTSGVTAVVFGGLYLGPRRYQVLGGPARLQIAHIYDVLVFLLESAVFAIIGLQLPGLVRALPSAQHDFVLIALAVTAALLAARALWVTGATLLSGLNETPDGHSVTRRRFGVVAVTSWAGTRGVVPLAAALSIPTAAGTAAFPQRDLLLVLATACTVLTLVVQGLTLGRLVTRSGLATDPIEHQREEAVARHAAVAAALSRLDEIPTVDGAPDPAVDWLRREFRNRLDHADAALRGAEETQHAPTPDLGGLRSLRRDLIAVQSARLHELVMAGVISESVRRDVQRSLDLEEARIAEG